jgi:hypothetical protein
VRGMTSGSSETVGHSKTIESADASSGDTDGAGPHQTLQMQAPDS